jgi:hypothetical protein
VFPAWVLEEADPGAFSISFRKDSVAVLLGQRVRIVFAE